MWKFDRPRVLLISGYFGDIARAAARPRVLHVLQCSGGEREGGAGALYTMFERTARIGSKQLWRNYFSASGEADLFQTEACSVGLFSSRNLQPSIIARALFSSLLHTQSACLVLPSRHAPKWERC